MVGLLYFLFCLSVQTVQFQALMQGHKVASSVMFLRTKKIVFYSNA
uniref:Uncharacterized protein n=1 Tax=Rhizophora mucronata TaxID=61149 RepID=A0A2P2P497_RHIMU